MDKSIWNFTVGDWTRILVIILTENRKAQITSHSALL